MKKISSIIVAAILFASCGNSSDNRNGAPDSTASEVTGADTSGGYNANNGNVNLHNNNTMQDSGRYDASGKRYSETDSSNMNRR